MDGRIHHHHLNSNHTSIKFYPQYHFGSTNLATVLERPFSFLHLYCSASVVSTSYYITSGPIFFTVSTNVAQCHKSRDIHGKTFSRPSDFISYDLAASCPGQSWWSPTIGLTRPSVHQSASACQCERYPDFEREQHDEVP